MVNRLGSFWRRRAPLGERFASARKPGVGKGLLLVMALFFAWQTMTVSTRGLHRVALLAEQRDHPDVVVVQDYELARLERAVEAAEKDGADMAALERAFEEITRDLTDDAEREARRAELRHVYQRRGLDGFRPSVVPAFALWPSSELWYAGADPLAMLGPLALVASLLALAQVLQHVAGSDDDLVRVGPALEWLFSFPAPARALFFARAVSASAGPLVWLVLWPFYSVVFGVSSYGWLGIPIGAAAALYVALVGGGLRVLLETTLRQLLSPAWVSRVQALLLTLSLLPLLAAYAVAFSPYGRRALSWVAELPEAAFYSPLTLPLWLSIGGKVAWLSAFVGLVVLGAWLAFCVAVAERMVRSGITTGAGERSAGRSGAPIGSARGSLPLFRGALLKEWRSVLRDRRLAAQAFLAPLLLFGLQLLLNPSLIKGIRSNPRHAATAAFVVAAFSLTTGACSTLAAEGPALWFLYTAPQRLERLLLEKLWAWASVAALFALLVLLVVWSDNPALLVPSLPHAALAFAGIYVYSVIALGIGALGTDVLEPEPRRRLRPGSMYLFMLLVSLFAYSIYTPSWWAKLVQLVLSTLLAFALWQKLRDQLPFLLDPSEAPPPSIGVADGVLAVLAFFVLRSLFTFLLERAGLAAARALLIAFVCAGGSVAVLALIFFYRRRVPEVLSALGLTRRAGQPGGRLAQLGLGVGAGLVAASLAILYLTLVPHVPWLARPLEAAKLALEELDLDARLTLLALAVLAAPPFEELIFRGILYRGFRRSAGAPVAGLASALVFALMHPGVTAPPVFVMGLLAALAYERTGWLLTPIATHVTYNAIVVGSALS